jgi:ArsR family transcriptional regulator, arsenate/arsenite/antimonite-responsive transcriptional repressor
MEEKQAVAALAALAQEHRLAVFRLLVKEGPIGASAGDVADKVGVPPSTLSHHLAQLERAGLLRSWRVQRNIFYAVDVEGSRRLIAFLTEDCCQGHPQLCGYGTGTPRDDHDPSRPEAQFGGTHSANDPHQQHPSTTQSEDHSSGLTALACPQDRTSSSQRPKGGNNG